MENFRKTILTTVILLTVFSFASFGQTNVSGGIYSNTTWTSANSPYVVTGAVVVFPGVTLTIQPGVTVKLDTNKSIEIRQAKLIAVGTSTDSITFTSKYSSPTPGIWGSIWLNGGTFNSKFNFCNFRYAYGAIDAESTATLSVKNSVFKNNLTGLNAYFTIIHIDSCVFSSNVNYGVMGVENTSTVNHSTFLHNQCGLYAEASGGNFGSNSTFITNCVVDSNQIGVSQLYFSTVDNCIITHNQEGVSDDNGYGFSIIKNCIIDYNSDFGVNCTQGDSVVNCQIKYNGTGITDSAYYACGNGSIITKNNIENNTIGIKLCGSNEQIYCNKICNNSAYNFYYNAANGSNYTVANNYWCTTDSSVISAKIYDGYDNINLGLVNFIPFDTAQCLTPSCVTPTSNFNYTDSLFTYYFNDSSSASPSNWLWSFGDSTVSTLQNPIHIYPSDGFYTVCLIAGNSCGADTVCLNITVFTMGILKNNISFKITISPNPTTDHLTVTVPTVVSKTEIKIFNLLGELEYSCNETKQKADLDVSGLSSGLHIIQIATGNNISRQKFIKK